MARTKQTARKSTGRAPRYRLASRGARASSSRPVRAQSTFLREYGLPTLLWRVLRSAGYPRGMRPRYSWVRGNLASRGFATVLLSVPALAGSYLWTGWEATGEGASIWGAAQDAAFQVFEALLQEMPDVLVKTYPEVFPNARPRHDTWFQEKGQALSFGEMELQDSETPATSAVFALMKAYVAQEKLSLRRRKELFRTRRECDGLQFQSQQLRAALAASTEQSEQTTQELTALRQQKEIMQMRINVLSEGMDACTVSLTKVKKARDDAWSEMDGLQRRVAHLEEYVRNVEQERDAVREEFYGRFYTEHVTPPHSVTGSPVAGPDADVQLPVDAE